VVELLAKGVELPLLCREACVSALRAFFSAPQRGR